MVLTMVEAPLGAKQCLLAMSQGDASVRFKWGYSRGWVSTARYIYFAMGHRSLARYIYFTRCTHKHSGCLLFPPLAIAMIFVVMGNAGELRQHVRTLACGHATPRPSPNSSNFCKFRAFRFKHILHIKPPLHIKQSASSPSCGPQNTAVFPNSKRPKLPKGAPADMLLNMPATLLLSIW
jgi:hypothetical protein